MNYSDAIVWLKEHDVKKDDGSYYEFGEVSAEPTHQRQPWISSMVVFDSGVAVRLNGV